ncbi:MAG: CvpA family protein [Paracoccaceae bacterium]|tara:strand:- start:313 stop:861 length:549 start_codon:yes stop_codon:yes gene_type:complete
MDGLTIIDGVSIAVVLLSGILAYARGFLREVLAISGWIISIIIAFMLAPTGVPLVSEIPYLNKIVSGCEATTIISFALILAISVLVCSIFTPLLSNVVKRSVLNTFDQSLGFLFGALRGIILIVVSVVVYNQVAVDNEYEIVNNSLVYKSVVGISSNIETMLPNSIPNWLIDNYDGLVSSCD